VRKTDPTIALCRDDLESGRMRSLYVEAFGGQGHHALDDFQLSESLTATLAAKPKGAGWWVFAYGSLLWNPLFPFVEARPAIVRGLHRRFCLYSMASRGTKDAPGLVLGLERGGACTGVVYRRPPPAAIDELHLLWRREMVTGSYRPKWVKVKSQDRELVALAFTVRHDHPQYAGRLSIDDEAAIIANAAGAFGTSLDYLERTRVALVTHGIVDSYLEKIAAKVALLRGAA
jgi:cation transport protein ChaC